MQEPQISEERQLDWIAKIEAILLHSNMINKVGKTEFEDPYFSLCQFFKDKNNFSVQAKCSVAFEPFVNFYYEVDPNRKVKMFFIPTINDKCGDQFEEDLNVHFERITNTTTLRETSEILFID